MGEGALAAELGVDPKDTEIKIEETEITPSQKSLGGNDLPPDWPQITPDSEYQHKFSDFTPGVDQPIEKLSLYLTEGPKQLTYLAVEHTNNPDSPQFAALETNFRSVAPHVVLHEGPANQAQIPDRETAIKYGETAFLHYLVQQHNANLKEGQAPIAIESADMTEDEWIRAFQANHTNEEIAVLDILRKVNVVAEQIRRDSELTDDQKATALNRITEKLNTDISEYFSENGFANLLNQLPRNDGKEWNQETIQEEVRNLTGQPLSANLNQLNVERFKKMFDEESVFRDKSIVKRIASNLRATDRVLAVMGSSHVLREEAALEKLFDIAGSEEKQI